MAGHTIRRPKNFAVDEFVTNGFSHLIEHDVFYKVGKTVRNEVKYCKSLRMPNALTFPKSFQAPNAPVLLGYYYLCTITSRKSIYPYTPKTSDQLLCYVACCLGRKQL